MTWVLGLKVSACHLQGDIVCLARCLKEMYESVESVLSIHDQPSWARDMK